MDHTDSDHADMDHSEAWDVVHMEDIVPLEAFQLKDPEDGTDHAASEESEDGEVAHMEDILPATQFLSKHQLYITHQSSDAHPKSQGHHHTQSNASSPQLLSPEFPDPTPFLPKADVESGDHTESGDQVGCTVTLELLMEFTDQD